MVNQDIAQHFLVANSIHQTKKSQPSSKDLAPDEREWLFDNTRGACKNALVMERILDQFGRVISAACVSQYKGMRSLENIGSRGRRGLLTGKESSLVLQAFDKMREQAVPVYAALVASVARGIKEQPSPKSTSLKGGPLKFSLSWAKDWMKQNNIRVRHATSDRTVTPNEVVEASKTFFSQLESYKNRCEKELVFNTDEFSSTTMMYPASLRVPTSIQPSPTLFAHREHFAERKKCRTLCRLCKNFPKLRLWPPGK